MNYLINHGWNVGTSSELAANGHLTLVNGIMHGALFNFMFPCYKSAAEFVMFFIIFSVTNFTYFTIQFQNSMMDYYEYFRPAK